MERDPNTLSNYRSWLTKHTTANFSIDFDARRLKGSVTLQLQSQTDSVSKEIVLDTSYLSISGVTLNNQPAKWHVADRVEPFGSPLHVAVPEGVVKGTDIELTVDVATTDCCTALQWLTPQQTSNGRAPYMFSQCQAIHARSIFPCQDTPDVKSTFSFNISSPLPVVASGLSVDADDGGAPGQREHAGESWTGEWKQEGERPVKLYRFEQKVPIPSYLFALASGDIATARIGPRSLVANSPELLEASRWELEHDVEKFMEVADGLVFPYQWGMYNVLVLPPSFPYGGVWTVSLYKTTSS